MSLLMRKDSLRALIRESYLKIIREQSYERDIVGSIIMLKDELRKRNLMCSTQFYKPTSLKKHKDYGYCIIKVDTSMGKGAHKNPKSISRLVNKLYNKLGMQKYFSFYDNGYDGRYCECGLKLKPKYVNKYLMQQKEK